ncbi:MAG: Ku protein [Actinomycetota bacterium]|nr:Ku protein [Actinomycetota bacterium]
MKAIWKGAISFGLVTIPVKVFVATEEKTIRFHQIHAKDGGRIRYKRVCSECGEEVAMEEIAKGYEYEKDRMVMLEEQELERSSPAFRSIDIVGFVPLDEIDPIYWQKSYYIAPEQTGLKAYALLRKALGDEGLVALARFTIRDKEHLATLRLRGNVFVLESMFWPDEIREPEFDELENEPEVRPQELKMAQSLIESMTEHFDPAAYTDEYRKQLEEVIAAKIQGEEIAVVTQKPATTVVDLMEALRQSVEQVEATGPKSSGAEPAKKKAAPKKKKAAAG